MALTLLDLLTPWRQERMWCFLAGVGEAHTYMVHVGAGWALARFRREPDRPLPWMDPLLRWLAVDGYGFHQGYFHWRRYIEKHEAPRRASGYVRRAFDQGLGRSLWFVCGAGVDRVASALARFPASRRSDLWSGVGLACAYAGGTDPPALDRLMLAAGPFRAPLCQGVAFAAKARARAGNPAFHTELACQVLCGTSAAEAAAVTDCALQSLPADSRRPAYEVWRSRVQDHFAAEVVDK